MYTCVRVSVNMCVCKRCKTYNFCTNYTAVKTESTYNTEFEKERYPLFDAHVRQVYNVTQSSAVFLSTGRRVNAGTMTIQTPSC